MRLIGWRKADISPFRASRRRFSDRRGFSYVIQCAAPGGQQPLAASGKMAAETIIEALKQNDTSKHGFVSLFPETKDSFVIRLQKYHNFRISA
jgi:hypothetical protein